MPADFTHRAHLRLAYIYLAGNGAKTAYEQTCRSLQKFLNHHGIDSSKFHQTMTYAWILAVRHFMEKTEHSRSADDFVNQNPLMLDTAIMMTHYSREVLFSDKARSQFVEPDLDPIPRYAD